MMPGGHLATAVALSGVAYATTGSDRAVYEIPLQAAMDLENTANRLYSDATAPRSGKAAAAATTQPAASDKNNQPKRLNH